MWNKNFFGLSNPFQGEKMLRSSTIFGRVRLLMSAKLAGRAAPLNMHSYLAFIHYRRAPLPEFRENAECRIEFVFDNADESGNIKNSFVEEIYSGLLVFSKGGQGKAPGFYLPSEAIESAIPKISKCFLEIAEDDRWDLSDLKKAFAKTVLGKGQSAFSIAVSNETFTGNRTKSLSTLKIVFEFWILMKARLDAQN